MNTFSSEEKEFLLEQVKGHDAYRLKLIAISTMLIDHSYKVFLIFLVPLISNIFNIGEMPSFIIILAVCGIGSITMPVFAFLIAEGCRYTHNSLGYLGRLFLFGIIAEVPYQIMLNAMKGIPISLELSMTNIMFTFTLGASACFAFKALSDKNHHAIKWFAPFVCCISAYLLHTDYGAYGVLFVFISYIIADKRVKFVSLTGLILLFCGVIYPLMDIVANGLYVFIIIQNAVVLAYSLLSLLLLLTYNGKRGKKSKYFFYIFYPLHMLMLGLIFVFIS